MGLEIVIVVVTLVGVLYWLIRGRGHSVKPTGVHTSAEPDGDLPSPEKDEALERFRVVHAKARDHLAKVREGIESDPHRATQAFRQFMNKE